MTLSAVAAAPFFFGPPERPLFGWLHSPANASVGAGGLGVVVCNPFGYEEVCAHRALRHIADAIANAGGFAVRFDYDGTGNSAGDDRDPDRVAAWVRSIHLAADALRTQAGVTRVYVLGVRLGALLAALAAEEREYAGLMAIAPVVSGKAYLRELRVLQMALGLAEPPAGTLVEEGFDEAIGFRITAATKAALTQVDLARGERRPPLDVLVLDRDDLSPTSAWQEKLRAAGAVVEAKAPPGYLGMVADPHKTVVPQKIIEDVVAWLTPRLAAIPASSLTPGATPPPLETRVRLTVPAGDDAPADVFEEAIFLDEARSQFAMKTTPVSGAPSGQAILLLNAGSVRNIGPNRLYVTLARRWAALGHLVLRLDNAGIGESKARPGEPENVVYAARAVDDVAAATRYLRAQERVTRVDAIGLCSGAYHGFKAAVAGHPLDAVIAINPLTFFWDPAQSLDYPTAKVASEARRYGESARSLQSWKKLLRGDVHFRALAEVLRQRAFDLARRDLREIARRLRIPLAQDLGAELDKVARARVALHFVFAEGDPGSVLLSEQGGSVVPRVIRNGSLSLDFIDGPDHTFTAIWSHEVLAAVLTRHVTAPLTGARARAPR
jgi:alpha-beta hydrolase superfamily lysophospholipase